jgi:hypothetical protein
MIVLTERSNAWDGSARASPGLSHRRKGKYTGNSNETYKNSRCFLAIQSKHDNSPPAARLDLLSVPTEY